jgi:hypothetical protein
MRIYCKLQASNKLQDGMLGTVIEYHNTNELQFPSISICPFEFNWIMNKYEETKSFNITH